MVEETRDETAPLTITKFSIEGYKRIRNISVIPAPVGLTKLGGKNKQGKTSTIEAIAHALLGPEAADKGIEIINSDAVEIPGTRGALSRNHIELSDGTIVERRFSGKNGRTGVLEVKLPSGQNGSLEDIKLFVSKFALVPPSIGDMTERERLKWLLTALHVDLSVQEAMLAAVTAERQQLHIEKERAQKHANDLPFNEGCPATEVKASEITAEMQTIMNANSANQVKRQEIETIKAKAATVRTAVEAKRTRVAELEAQLVTARQECVATEEDLKTAQVAFTEASSQEIAEDLPTDALQKQLEDTDALNQLIRQNITKQEKIEEAAKVRAAWTEKGNEVNDILRDMKDTVSAADIPMSYIGINDDLCITFDGQTWGGMSGMQRLILRTSIASLYNPKASFVCCDGLEALDEDMQLNFHKWAVGRGLQILATEVTSNYEGEKDDDGITRLIIADGMVQE